MLLTLPTTGCVYYGVQLFVILCVCTSCSSAEWRQTLVAKLHVQTGEHLCRAQGEKMDEVIVEMVVEQLIDHVGVTSM